MKKFTCLLIVILSGFLAAHAQSFSVSGNVTDESGIPLLGVNVLVKSVSGNNYRFRWELYYREYHIWRYSSILIFRF